MPLEAAWDLQMQMPPLWLRSSWPSLISRLSLADMWADYWLSPRICVAAGMILMGLGYLCTWRADSMFLV